MLLHSLLFIFCGLLEDKRENNCNNFVLLSLFLSLYFSLSFFLSLFLCLCLQGLFIFLIYGVYNTEVSLHCVSRLSEWMREMTSFWWAPCLKAVWVGCDSTSVYVCERVCGWEEGWEGGEGTSFPRERPTALHAWTNLYASESDH